MQSVLKSVGFTAVLTYSLTACFADHQPESAALSFDLLRGIEARLTMPAKSAPLSSYDRYYAFGKRDGRIVLIGVFLAPDLNDATLGQAPSIHIALDEDELPAVFDGGCSVVNLVADPSLPEEAKLWCNGVS